MATLGEMVTAVVQETRRYDSTWPDRVRREIAKAIRHYQQVRFGFNESRDLTFETVDGQAFYTVADDAQIPLLHSIDYITLTQGASVTTLTIARSQDLDELDTTSAARGVPFWFVYYERKLRLYPIPNGIYTVRVAGLVSYPAPASDAEAGNYWMTDAEELIRSRTKRNLFLHHMTDRPAADDMQAAEEEALQQLRIDADMRGNVHEIQPDGVF